MALSTGLDLVRELQTIDSSLDKLARKLDRQFSERFEGGTNPMSLLKRIQKLQGELPSLRESCQQVIERKQALVDIAKEQLVMNRQHLHELAARTGCPVLASDQHAYEGFTQAMGEWQLQVASAQPAGDYNRDDLNRALAQSMVAK